MKTRSKLTVVFAVSLMLLGAFLMFNGQILGESTTGIARVLGILGICLMGSTSRHPKSESKEPVDVT